MKFGQVLEFVAVCGVFVALGVGSAPPSDLSEGPRATPPPAPTRVERTPTVDVSAKALLKAYQDNQVAADQRYKGKVLRITGVVDNVTNGIFGGYDLQINGGGRYEIMSITCKFKEASQVASLSPGQRIVVSGKVDTGMTIGVNMRRCSIVSVR